jgi:hypothetical protein
MGLLSGYSIPQYLQLFSYVPFSFTLLSFFTMALIELPWATTSTLFPYFTIGTMVPYQKGITLSMVVLRL